jgi:hypothetical protein
MWTNENRARYDRNRLRYPSDLTDDEWKLVEPLIPPGRRGGDKRTVILREVVNGLMYILSTGCQWRAIPKDLPPRSTLYDYFDLWSWDRTLDLIHHELYVKCGASVGVIPTKWAFSKDPARPLGVDITESILLEWSCVSLPCNPQCLLVGSVSNKSANETKIENSESNARERRLAEARSLREPSPGSKIGEVTTREQRLAEAAKIRRMVYSK